MTPKERANPKIIDASRRRRIARGSGTETEDVSGLCKQFLGMRDMMKKMAGMSLRDRMKFGTQYAQSSMLTGKMPTLKSKPQHVRKMHKRDKRKARKRKSR